MAGRPAARGTREQHKADGAGWPLRLRLLVTVSIALLPIAIASVLQGIDRAHRDMADVRERLVQSAHAASTGEENMLASGEQILRALANMPDVRDASAGCNRALNDALRGLSFIVNLSRVGPEGRVICSANPKAVGFDMTTREVWSRAKKSKRFEVSEQVISYALKRPVILGILPLKNARGEFFGTLTMALDVRWLDYIVRSRALPQDAIVAIFDREGTVIASTNKTVARQIFAKVEKKLDDQQELQSAQDEKGTSWSYATSALLGQSIFVGFAMPDSNLFAPTYLHVGTDFLMPILMIALAWAAIWVATDRQVTRWIDYLRRIALAYRSGHYSIRPALENAPAEFHMLGDSLANMADAIQDRDKRLREALAQKSLLIREIHHRVKNNLQIVVSLLNIQARELKDPAAEDALRQARMRINALALVHRILHDVEDQTVVDLKPLLEDLAAQTHEGLGGDRRDIQITNDICSRTVPGDLAVAVALFAVEALTNAYKHAFPEGGGSIHVNLTGAGDGDLELRVEDNGIGFSPEHVRSRIGAQLINTFGQQAGGNVSVISKAGQGTAVSLRFPDPFAQNDRLAAQ